MEYTLITNNASNFIKVCTECEADVVRPNLRINGGTLNYSGLTYDSDFLILCTLDKKIIGFISIIKDDNMYYIYQIAVINDFKRKGIATELINHIKELDNDATIVAHARSYNEASKNMLLKNGFVYVDELSTKDNYGYMFKQKKYGEKGL